MTIRASPDNPAYIRVIAGGCCGGRRDEQEIMKISESEEKTEGTPPRGNDKFGRGKDR